MYTNNHWNEPPVDLRFIDLFMIIIAALVLISALLMLSAENGAAGRPLEIMSKAVPVAILNEPYSVQLASGGGTAPLAWQVIHGELPSGLRLREGQIEGTPLVTASEQLVLELKDARGKTDQATINLVVQAISTQERPSKVLTVEADEVRLDDAAGGVDYSSQLVATGGRPPYTWKVEGGQLPPGLMLNAEGRLKGTPFGKHPSLLWMLFASDDTRHHRVRQINRFRFETSVTDVVGQRRRQGVTLFVQPSPRSFGVQLLLGDFAVPVDWPLETLSRTLRVILVVTLYIVVGIAVIPLFLLISGDKQLFDLPFELHVQGWSGFLWKAFPEDENDERELRPASAALALTVRAIFGPFLRMESVQRREREIGHPLGIGEAQGDGGGLGSGTSGGETGEGGYGLPHPNREDQDRYLDNLRRGGVVRHGGAFLGLSFVRKLELPGVVDQAFRRIPEVGKGLLHASLDRYFRYLLQLQHPMRSFAELDERFAAVLARKGPASPEPAEKGERQQEENPQGEIVLPSSLDANKFAAEQLDGAMKAAADEARDWMGQLLREATGQPVRKRFLQRLLRTDAEVRLEEGVVCVRLMGFTREKDRRAATNFCVALNTFDPRMLGRHPLPIRFEVASVGEISKASDYQATIREKNA